MKKKKQASITHHEVSRLVKKWRKVMGIEPEYKIMCAIAYHPEECAEEYREAEAAVLVQDGYFYVELVINAYNLEPEDLELAVVHELTHIVLHPLGESAKNALGDRNTNRATAMLEQATERISRALVKLGGEA